MNPDYMKKYAALRGLNIGQAEKDYYQNLVLFILYGKTTKELVFKGGTALSRCYGLNRFSEDLDFTVNAGSDFIRMVSEGLTGFGVVHSMREIRKNEDGSKYRLKVEGPLYSGSEKTLCSVTLDFSTREKAILEPAIVTIGYHMDVIPAFEVYVMKEREILAEKIRALMSRESARDMYDLVFLIRKGVSADSGLINDKLRFYRVAYDKKALLARCNLLKKIWESELRSLVRVVPDFEECIRELSEWQVSEAGKLSKP